MACAGCDGASSASARPVSAQHPLSASVWLPGPQGGGRHQPHGQPQVPPGLQHEDQCPGQPGAPREGECMVMVSVIIILYHSPQDPLSPRRVEFADEVFNFQSRGTPATSRPGSRCESPNPKVALNLENAIYSMISRESFVTLSLTR